MYQHLDRIWILYLLNLESEDPHKVFGRVGVVAMRHACY